MTQGGEHKSAEPNFPPLRVEALSAAIDLFDFDQQGRFHFRDALGTLASDLSFMAQHAEYPQRHQARYRIAADNLHAVVSDVWNIGGIVDRLEWTRQLALRDQSARDRWRQHAELDLSHIISQFRSIFDLVAVALAQLAPRPGQTPDSFETLLNGKDTYSAKLGSLAGLLDRDFWWFFELREIRTAILHQGREFVVFGKPEEGVAFQLFQRGHKKYITHPAFLENANVARFDFFVAYHFAETLDFLKDFANLARAEVNPPKISVDSSRNYAPGYIELVAWMRQLRDELVRVPRAATPVVPPESSGQ